jgi:hypothetical protein
LISARKWFENITYGANVSGIGRRAHRIRAQFPKGSLSRRAKQLAPVLNGDWMPIRFLAGHEKERISATPPQKLCAGPLSNSETLKLASS